MTKNILKLTIILMIIFLPLRMVTNLLDDYIAIIFISIISLYILFISLKNINEGKIIIIAFILRFITILIDIYFNNYVFIPNSGADSEGFYRVVLIMNENPEYIFSNSYGGLYTKILGVISLFIGTNRFLMQFINLLLGIIIIDLVWKFLRYIKIQEKHRYILITIISFFPQKIIFSSILLREDFIVLFNSISFIFLFLTIETNRKKYLVYSIISILIASLFHSGSIFGLLGILLIYGWRSRFLLIDNKVIKSILFVGIFIFFYISFKEVFFGKFLNIDSLDDILDLFETSRGSSAYLTNINPENIFHVILWLPLLFIYFLTMPLPHAFRGGLDLFSFILDSTFYIFFLYQLFKNRKTIKESKYGVLILFIFLPLVVFSIGVRNTGTAIRHRHKFFPVMVMYLAIIWNEKNKLSNKDKEVEDAKNEIYIKNS